MKASVNWLNSWLPGTPLSAEQIEAVLTDVGFPIDAREPLPGGDMRLEVEITSNRGDCLSHEHLAREIAAKTGRALRGPTVPPVRGSAGPASKFVRLEHRAGDACPRFTLRVIKGCTIGPSPAWLVDRLAAVGQRSINNVVDVTNYLTFEYGQPCHAFDLAKLGKSTDGVPTLIVRFATDGEALTTLDGKARALKSDELVVADAARAQSLAGVIGGGDSEVSASTRDIALEVATWDPVVVRRAARRHQIRTDASHRFERLVDARAIDGPAAHAAALIAELTGGQLCDGSVEAGRPMEPLREIAVRGQRCRDVLGVPVRDEEMVLILQRLGMEIVASAGGVLRTRVPAVRRDLEREIDLIEEVARIKGLDQVPLKERISIEARPPQRSEIAVRAIGAALNGLGFFETVTFSFVSPKAAKPFLPAGLSLLSVDDSRRKEEPTLRPSILPSLLACRRANQDGQVDQPGGVRLYETSATFAERPGADRSTTESVRERRMLALLMDVPGVGRGKSASLEERQHGLRLMRGAIESVAGSLGLAVTVAAAKDLVAAFDPAGSGAVSLAGVPIGTFGLLAADVQKQIGLDVPLVIAEIELDPFVAAKAPIRRIEPLPAFPAIERDLSIVVGEGVAWQRVEASIAAIGPALAEFRGARFVGTYRGKPLAAGTKSVTLRLAFRAADRTLRDEDVTPSVQRVVETLAKDVGAVLRA